MLDFASGALSSQEKFVDVFAMIDRLATAKAAMASAITGQSDNARLRVFNASDLRLLENTKDRVARLIQRTFGISSNKLWLTSPSFLSRIHGDKEKPAKTKHDEYWHSRLLFSFFLRSPANSLTPFCVLDVDRIQYGSFAMTALVYLNNYNVDYTGGRFIFEDGGDQLSFVEPRVGRLSLFTSGAENTHRVEKVETGVRYALTIAFTCDKSKALSNYLSRFKEYAE